MALGDGEKVTKGGLRFLGVCFPTRCRIPRPQARASHSQKVLEPSFCHPPPFPHSYKDAPFLNRTLRQTHPSFELFSQGPLRRVHRLGRRSHVRLERLLRPAHHADREAREDRHAPRTVGYKLGLEESGFKRFDSSILNVKGWNSQDHREVLIILLRDSCFADA